MKTIPDIQLTMIYKINYFGELVIHNDSGNEIFNIDKYNRWFKSDFDHGGYYIYREDSEGFKLDYTK